MTTSHTPGPWKVGEEIEHDDFGDLARIWGGDELIATVNCDDYANCDMDQANARLIAEAPAMLEALKDVAHEPSITYCAIENCGRCKAQRIIDRIEGTATYKTTMDGCQIAEGDSCPHGHYVKL